ncbi:hypothetical protein SLS64_003574 [Diaporthe eres]|uniref:Ankyrin repeat protein n=1 Tax=Diaporthe eres TaxID=83184 RepID=A0ABR1PCI6_DIAER
MASQERMDMPSCISPLQAAALKGRYGIFRQLLDMGASVNGRARGFKGMTAIQAVCSWDTKTTEERCRKIDMLQRLINCNADVNGAPAKHWGCTALQITALQGDLEIAAMLLTHGANVNAPPCNKNDGFMALDGAAELGRLDMVKFLLNANALSLRRGRDGYEGARRAAEENGHFAVVEIIDKHAEFNSLCGTKNPLQFLPRQSRKEAYDELDSEVDDSDLETESDTAMELDQVSDAEQFEDDISAWESDFSEAQEVPSTKDLIDIESVGRHEDMPFQSYSGLLDSSEFSDDE